MTTPQIKLSDATGVPYYRQIVDQITQLIRSGRLQPEEQLPSVRDLAGRLLVSLITTRRAYSDLENAGLIVRRQGHGTFVAKEIEMTTHEQAIEEMREKLAEVVGHGRRMGLGAVEMRKIFDEAITTEGGHNVGA